MKHPKLKERLPPASAAIDDLLKLQTQNAIISCDSTWQLDAQGPNTFNFTLRNIVQSTVRFGLFKAERMNILS